MPFEKHVGRPLQSSTGGHVPSGCRSAAPEGPVPFRLHPGCPGVGCLENYITEVPAGLQQADNWPPRPEFWPGLILILIPHVIAPVRPAPTPSTWLAVLDQ